MLQVLRASRNGKNKMPDKWRSKTWL